MSKMPSFVDALHRRYGDYNVKIKECPCEIFVLGASPGKSGNHLVLPPSLSLIGCDITAAGNQREIQDLCRNVGELDLASNNLNDFDEILKIIKCMPNLWFLNLSENNLSKTQAKDLETVKLDTIKSLVLNNTNVPWNAIYNILDLMPDIDELHLSLNNYSTIQSNGKCYRQIKRLYVSNNPNLTSWQEVGKLLTTFPCLEVLTMADCNLSTISDDISKLLPTVQGMNISNWPIVSWEQLEKLNKLPNLVELRCQGISILNDINIIECRRQHLIARLPNIKRLNGSEVHSDERMHAEKAFLRWYITNNDKKPDRFFLLQSIHGRVDPLAEVDLSPPKYAEVKLIYNQINDNSMRLDCSRTKLMKIDLNKSVREFKSQLSTIFGLPVTQMRLYYRPYVEDDMADCVGPEELRFNQKKLYTYHIQDGDEFLIDPK